MGSAMKDLTSDQLAIRKNWLILLGVTFVLETLNVFFAPESKQMPLAIFGFSASITFIYKFLLYYFGYRKTGTKLLTFCIIGFVFGMIGSGALLLHHLAWGGTFLSSSIIKNFHETNSLFLLGSYIASFAFIYFTIKLRRQNLDLRRIRPVAENSPVDAGN